MSSAASRVIDLLDGQGITLPEDRSVLSCAIAAAIDELPVAYLHLAHCWDCEHCGVENFCRAITATDTAMGEEDEHPELQGFWLSVPDTVTCKACGHKFVTQPDDIEDSVE